MTFAFWCVLVAAILPYVPLGLSSRFLDPKTPRKSVQNLEGIAARAYAAHLNGFENFPPFAAAVIMSHVIEGPSTLVNWLALIFILARVAHIAAYLADRQPPRSAAWFVGLLAMIAIFVQNAFH
jgi:uncharacterized MAPEG superfamily protein